MNKYKQATVTSPIVIRQTQWKLLKNDDNMTIWVLLTTEMFEGYNQIKFLLSIKYPNSEKEFSSRTTYASKCYISVFKNRTKRDLGKPQTSLHLHE